MKRKQPSKADKVLLIRQLQYRLQRQGMLELDTWLAPLSQAINAGDADVLTVTKEILGYEAPDLLAMRAGSKEIPEVLKPWLKL